MFHDQISDYFEGVAAKYLSAVDADPERSHQHEIGGLPSAGFKQYLGTPGKSQEYRFVARQVYLTDDADAPLIYDGLVTWYDCRRYQQLRSPEYRLYYDRNHVTERLSEGDFFLVAKFKTDQLLMVFAPKGSTIEAQLRALFGIGLVDQKFRPGELKAGQLLLPLRLLLEDLGIEIAAEEGDDDTWLSKLTDRFGGDHFPTTSEFSIFARQTTPEAVDPTTQPDTTLLAWMDHEERLFRIYERHIVQVKLRTGFGEKGDDVDEFINFSLSVQNRRKSRVGHAFEGHLHTLFTLNKLRFQQGRGKGTVTENNAKPDFLFPDFASYHSKSFSAEKLRMLGAKTTCKDRWRQVLSEASRIQRKHLVTLEAAISEPQTNEMQSHELQLVVPTAIQSTYSANQQKWLMGLGDFIKEVRLIQL